MNTMEVNIKTTEVNMKTINIAVLAALLGLAGQGAAFADGQDTHLPIKAAHYSVPVSAELASFATFDIQNIELSEGANGLNISYRLPAEIVGSNSDVIRLSRASSAGDGSLEKMVGSIDRPQGPRVIADASCSKHPFNPKKILCMIVYDALLIDSEQTTDFLSTEYQGSSDLSKRLQVAALFANEPAGVLLLELE
jgi:hypothetical protein